MDVDKLNKVVKDASPSGRYLQHRASTHNVPSLMNVDAPSEAPKYENHIPAFKASSRNVPSLMNVDAPSEAPKYENSIPTTFHGVRNVPSIMDVDKLNKVDKEASTHGHNLQHRLS